eukprot:10434484-Karenia_brevis.AAC.1
MDLTADDRKTLNERRDVFSHELQAAAKAAFGQMVAQVQKAREEHKEMQKRMACKRTRTCLLYTSDAADDM